MQEHIEKGNVIVDIIRNENEACRPVELKINGIKANLYDLGYSRDLSPETAPPCGCGNRTFIMKDIKEYTLKNFNLSIEDLDDLKSILEANFTIGLCKRCK